MIIGGVPEYLMVAPEYPDIKKFLINEFLDTRGYFYREPYYILSQDLKEIRVYFGLLNAIAFGNTKPTNIANFVGIETRAIYPYLETLQRLGIIKREIAIGGNPKRGIYVLQDSMLYSWFNVVYPRRHEIELDISRLGLTQRWKMRIAKLKANELVCDEAVESPFTSFIHYHRFIPLDKTNSWLCDELEFSLPCYPLSLIILPFIKKDIQKMFDYRHQKTKTILEKNNV